MILPSSLSLLRNSLKAYWSIAVEKIKKELRETFKRTCLSSDSVSENNTIRATVVEESTNDYDTVVFWTKTSTIFHSECSFDEKKNFHYEARSLFVWCGKNKN